MSSLSEMWGFRNFDLCIIDHPLTFKEDERWGRPVRRGAGGGWWPLAPSKFFIDIGDEIPLLLCITEM